MDKPITLLREEFARNLVEVCNASGLPYFVIEGVLRDMLGEVHAASVKQYEADLKRYAEATSEEKDD